MSSMRSMTSPPTPAGGSPVGQIERLMENRLASSELALHRIHADPANPRQLTVGQAVDVAEREEDAGLAGHALERALEVHRFHVEPADRPRRRAGLRVLGANAPPPELVETDVRQGAIEPRRQRPSGRIVGAGREAVRQRSRPTSILCWPGGLWCDTPRRPT